MIYCVRYDEVVEHLKTLGFRQIGQSEEARAFARPGLMMSLRAPNQDGHVPENLVNDAFDAAGLDPPVWDVFWCD